MSGFLKDYISCFFSHKRSKQIYKRSFLITFISVILIFFSIFCSSFLSQEISFKNSVKNAPEFTEILSDILPNEEIINNGKLNLNFVYDSNKEDTKNFLSKGFHVYVDTRDPKTTFDDFTFVMKNENNEVISYDQYLLMTDETKEEYSAVITRSGTVLDTVSNITLYENFLETRENKTEFYNLKNKFQNGELSELDYANSLYILYGKEFYPEDVYSCDSYGGLPTIRTYYLSLINSFDIEENYIFLFNEGMECSFTSKSKHVSFFGYFDGMEDIDLSLNKEGKINSLVFDAFKSSRSLRSISYLFISFFVWFIYLIAFVLVVFIFRIILAISRKHERHYLLKIMNLLGAYSLFACIFSFILGLFLGFVFDKLFIFIIVPVVTLAIVCVRGLIYYIVEKEPSDFIKEE